MIQPTQRHFREQLMRKRQAGMTLMELMIVIMVVAILGTIALNSYRRYMLRAQRSDATTSLLQLQSQQEKHFLQYGVYVTTTGDITKAHSAGGLGLAATTSQRGYYDLAVSSTTTGYTASATPVSGGGQADDKDCASFSITESGTKTALKSSGTDNTNQCFR